MGENSPLRWYTHYNPLHVYIYICVWFFCLHICLHYIFHLRMCDSVACSLVSSPWCTIFKFSKYYIIILCNLPSWQTWSHIYIRRIESTRRALLEKKPNSFTNKQQHKHQLKQSRTLRHTPPGSYNRWSG